MNANEPVTVINVLDVDPARQNELLDLLREGIDQVVRHRPGFLAARLLASNDGSRVVNYAEWRGLDDVKATMADPEVQRYARQAGELAHAAPHVYSVVAAIGG